MAKTSKHSSKILLGLAGLMAVGAFLFGMLAKHYYDVKAGASGFKSFCNINSSFNCDTVASSRYAEIFPGLPVASLGVGFTLAILILLMIARADAWRRNALRAAFTMISAGIIYGLFLFVMMATQVHSYCIQCLLTDVILWIGFLGLLWIKNDWRGPISAAATAQARSQWKSIVGFSLAAFLVSIIAMKGFDPASGEEAPTVSTEERVTQILADKPVSVNTGSELPSIGASQPKVTIVEFSDFQCPFCRMTAVTLNHLVARFPDQVRVVFRNFPLNSSCNRKMDRPMHPAACEAAQVVTCANRQGKFKAAYEALFEKQSELAAGRPLPFAVEAGVDQAQLETCMKSEATQAAISRDVEEALTLEISATPTLFANGLRIQGAMNLDAWTQLVERMIALSK